MTRSAPTWLVSIAMIAACRAKPTERPEPPGRFVRAMSTCTHRSGPARPLVPSEVGYERRVHRAGHDDHSLLADELERMDWTDLEVGERIDAWFRLANSRMHTAEEQLEIACALEREAASDTERDHAWSLVDRDLRLAADAAEGGAALTDAIPSEQLARFSCVQVVVSSRLGELPRARGAASALGHESCSVQALVELGHALALDGEHDEADAAFDRALALDQQLPTTTLACPALTNAQPGFTIDCDAADCGVEVDLFVRWCSWTEYLRYRRIHAARAGGTIGAREANESLRELAESLRASERPGVETIVAAIEVDLGQREVVQAAGSSRESSDR